MFSMRKLQEMFESTLDGQSNNSFYYVIFQIQQGYGLLDNLNSLS